jgi:uncharacterized membrane protein YqjE
MQTPDMYQKLLEETKEYVQTRYDLLRIEFVEKASKIVAFFLLAFVIIGFLLGAFVYLSLALVIWLSTIFESLIIASLFVGGVLALFGGLVYSLRESLFVNPIIKQMSKIMFSQKPNENDQ